MLNSAARLLRLLSLLAARRDWTSVDLAQRLAITTRTVRRDVERLRTVGYLVHATSGPAGGYRLEAGTTLPPLLPDDEAVAIAVGLPLTRTSSARGSRHLGHAASTCSVSDRPSKVVVGLESPASLQRGLITDVAVMACYTRGTRPLAQ